MVSSPSEETLASFNRLVYEYLVKMKLKKSADAFKSECNVGEVHLNDSLPVLLNWYSIFLETADVRSGKVHAPASLNRIEGIMLKLENEKARCVKMSSLAPHADKRLEARPSPSGEASSPGADHRRTYSPDRASSGEYAPGYDRPSPRDRSYPPPPEMAGPRAAVPVPPYGRLKEYKRLELNIPFILVARYCSIFRILVCCCTDGKMYFYSIAKGTLELACHLPYRQVGCLKVLEAHDCIFLLMDFADNTLFFSRYADGQREDLHKLRMDEPVRSYCFGKNTIYVLTESSTLHVYSFAGELLRTLKMPASVFSVDYFGKNLLLAEPSRVVEFDVSINMEIKTLGRGARPALFVKDEYAFLIFSDSIQVFNRQSPFPIVMLKSSLVPRDIDLVFNRVIVAAGCEVFCGNDVLPISNAIVVANCILQDMPLLLVLTSEGYLVFFAVNCINEYI